MKDFIANRTHREKIFLVLSAIVFAVFILYWFIWEPIVNSYLDLQKDIVYNQQLLSWMQDKQGLLLQNKSESSATSGKDLFLIIDEDFKKNVLKDFKPEMIRLSENRVTVKFNQVPFDELLNASSSLLSQYNTDIAAFEASKLREKPGESGMVQVNVTYTR